MPPIPPILLPELIVYSVMFCLSVECKSFPVSFRLNRLLITFAGGDVSSLGPLVGDHILVTLAQIRLQHLMTVCSAWRVCSLSKHPTAH
jgi:hypothetical protein